MSGCDFDDAPRAVDMAEYMGSPSRPAPWRKAGKGCTKETLPHHPTPDVGRTDQAKTKNCEDQKRKAEIWEYGAASSKPFTPPHSPERGQASHLFSAGPLSPLEVQVVDPAQPKAKILNQTLEPWPFDPSPVCVLPDLGDVLTDWRRVPTVFTKTRDRLLTTEMSHRFCRMSISRSMERW